MQPSFFSFCRAWLRGAWLLLGCLALPGVTTLRAQTTSTWTGATSGAWGTATNWTSAPAFDGTDQLLLSTLKQPSQTLGADRSIHTLTISQGGFTVSGSTLNLQASGSGIFSTGNNTLNSTIVPFVNASSTVRSNSGTLTLGGVLYNVNANLATPSPILDGNGNFVLNGGAQGGGGPTMNGTGTLLLNGTNNTYSGALTINSGTFMLGDANGIANGGPLILSGGTFDLNGLNPTVRNLAGSGTVLLGNNTLTVTGGGSPAFPITFNGPISGSGGLVLQLNSGSVQALGGTSSYTGGTQVLGGFLTYSADANLGAASGLLTLNGGGIEFGSNGGTVTRPVVVLSGGAVFSCAAGTNCSLPTAISGTGPVVYGYSTTTTEGTWVARGSYTYKGVTNLFSGALAITDPSQLGAASNAVTASTGSLLLRGGITVAGRTLTLSGFGNNAVNPLGALVSDTGANVWSGPINLTGFSRIGVASGSSLTLSGAITADPTTLPGLTFNTVGDLLVTGKVSADLSKNNTGTLTLAGNNAAPSVAVNQGTLLLQGSGAVASAARITLGTGATLRLGADTTLGDLSDNGTTGTTVDLGSHDLTVQSGYLAATVMGTGRIFMEGANYSLSLRGNNTFSGGLYVDAGALYVTGEGSFGAASNPVVLRGGSIVFPGGTFSSTNHPLTFAAANAPIGVSAGTFTFNQALTNIGALVKSGDGTLVLTGNNTYAGGTVLAGGTLSVSSDALLGAAGGGLTFQNGTLQITGTTFHTTTRPITLTGYPVSLDVADPGNTFTLGPISGQNSSLQKLGAGTLVLAGSAPFPIATVNAGSLLLGTSDVLPASGTVNVSQGATFDLHGNNQTTANLSNSSLVTTGAGVLTVSGQVYSSTQGSVLAGQLALSGSNVKFDCTNQVQPDSAITLDVSAAISGHATLTKVDYGILRISGNNPFTGALAVNVGTLNLTGSLTQTSGVTVATGAVLEVAGSGQLGSTGSIVNNGWVRLLGDAAFAAAGTITNNGVIDVSGWRGTLPANLVNGKGGVVVTADDLRVTQFTRSGSTLQLTVNAKAGLSYQLQRTSYLNPPIWFGVTSQGIAATANGPLMLTDPNPVLIYPAFYRVVLSLTPSSSSQSAINGRNHSHRTQRKLPE